MRIKTKKQQNIFIKYCMFKEAGMEVYKHVISLGFFCSVASELERIGLRDSSYPFDWLITGMDGILQLMDNEFSDFLCPDLLQQYTTNPSHFVNRKYNIHFLHDFDDYKKYEDQLDHVQQKYQRRIQRFYESISEPTLFVRYIMNQEECNYLELRLADVQNKLKRFNPLNSIAFISNDTIMNCNMQIYKVKADQNDQVARRFLDKNRELKQFLCSELYDPQVRRANYTFYRRKKLLSYPFHYPKKLLRTFKGIIFKVKTHDSLYNPLQ
jgi:Putative papain-like cysteine peptidase (DUF1796).